MNVKFWDPETTNVVLVLSDFPFPMALLFLNRS